jgi:drug/metabolite transporter (DMT)-like permease
LNTTWLLTIPAFIVFCAGAYCTYTKGIRESWVYLPAYIGLSLISSFIWVVVARRLDTTNNLLLFSLVWDVLMVLAYYAGPLIFKGENLSWQAYAAAALTVTGICWFKIATGD